MIRTTLIMILSFSIGVYGGWRAVSANLDRQADINQADAICDWTKIGYHATSVQTKGNDLTAICVGKSDSLNPTFRIWFKR